MSYTYLYMGCPKYSCNSSSSSYWSHNNCNGKIEINEFAYLRCNKCYYSDKFFSWRFRCEDCHEFGKADFDKVCNDLIKFSGYKNSMGNNWLKTLLANLVDD